MNDQPETAAEHPAVQEVLASLEALDDLAPDEHVAVFEQAHESLRRILAEAGSAPQD